MKKFGGDIGVRLFLKLVQMRFLDEASGRIPESLGQNSGWYAF